MHASAKIARETQANPAALPIPVYDLRDENGSSGVCFERVAGFSRSFLDEAVAQAGELLERYGAVVQTGLREPPRSPGEYAVELLNLGLFSARYSATAEAAPSWAIGAARGLYRLRRLASWIKPVADGLRARLVRTFLLPRPAGTQEKQPDSTRKLARLIAWLRATGEFEEESARLVNWLGFLATQPESTRSGCMETAALLGAWFEREAEAALGGYTRGVAPFLAGEYTRRGCREDQLFCGKEAVHYHLALVTSSLMNQGLREAFERTGERVVLAPGCLRGAFAERCQAHVSGVDIDCAGCSAAGTMNRLTLDLREQGVKVYIVPHSSGFSRWLERWQRTPNVGVTAVACLLNILPGGYEMRARGIPSQCVPLDYPGCARHWAQPAMATSVDLRQLIQTVATSSISTSASLGRRETSTVVRAGAATPSGAR